MLKYPREDKRLDSYFHSSFPNVSTITEIAMEVVENQWKILPQSVSTLLDEKGE